MDQKTCKPPQSSALHFYQDIVNQRKDSEEPEAPLSKVALHDALSLSPGAMQGLWTIPLNSNRALGS